MVASLLDTKMMERKVFLGANAFELFKGHFGILYGASFTVNGIEFILHPLLKTNSALTADPQLKILFKQFDARMRAEAAVSGFEGLIAEIKAKGVL